MSPRESFRRAVAGALDVAPEHVTLFWKGRVAFYAILRALGVRPGDEVVVPAFTCVAVPNAIIYAGARPVYADIDETFTPDPVAAAGAIGPRTRVVLAQSTFGLSSDIDALAALAAEHGAVVVDDCTHGFGGRYRDRPNGLAADVAFYSTQWSKPFSTGLGGIAVTTDPDLARELRALERSAREPRAREQAALCTMVWARERLATPRTIATGRTVYRALGRAGVVPGSSSRDELVGTSMSSSFFTRMSPAQGRIGVHRVSALDAKVDRRRAVAQGYSEWLDAHGGTPAVEPPRMLHAFLRYPLRVREREAFAAEARRRRVDLGDWFVSPVHPLTGDLSAWGYRGGTAPVAERIAGEIVNLPTDGGPGSAHMKSVIGLLDASVEHLL
jgi:dTDP-4-amino-4,6-dideoxygalactose transaminase